MCVGLVALICVLAPAVDARDAAKAPADVGYAGQTEQGLAAYVKLLPHSAGVTAAFTYTTSCSGAGGSILWTGVAKAPVKGGKFHYTRKEDAKGPQITLDGKVSPSYVSGTWRVRFTDRDALGTARGVCDSGAVDYTLPRDGAGGQVGGGYPVALRLAKTSVKSIEVVTQVNCKSGDSYLMPTFYANFRIGADGSFGRKFTDDGTPVAGKTSKLTVDLHGQVRRGQVKGTWRLNVAFSQGGKQVDTCDSGPLTWSAAV